MITLSYVWVITENEKPTNIIVTYYIILNNREHST